MNLLLERNGEFAGIHYPNQRHRLRIALSSFSVPILLIACFDMSSEQVELSQPQEDPPRLTAALAPLIPITEIEPNLDEPRKQPFMGTGTTMSDPADCNRMPSIGSDGSIGQFSNSYQSAPVSHNASKQFPARGANMSDYSFISPIQENGFVSNQVLIIINQIQRVWIELFLIYPAVLWTIRKWLKME